MTRFGNIFQNVFRFYLLTTEIFLWTKPCSQQPRTSDCTSEQHWYNPVSLFHSILSSNLAAEKMHFGMAEYVDEPVELWHSRSWGSSVRAASGDFVRIPDGSIIFPGDFVEFPPCKHVSLGFLLYLAASSLLGVTNSPVY